MEKYDSDVDFEVGVDTIQRVWTTDKSLPILGSTLNQIKN